MDILTIKDPVQHVANAISTVLMVDVEVINHEYIRVAGTGTYNHNIGHKIKYNYVYEKVINNKLDIFIANPREHEFCLPCPEKGCCQEFAELCTPIIHNSKVLGVFGLIAFDQQQKEILLHHKNELLPFIKQMGQLVVSKINENEYIEQLRYARDELLAIVNSVNEGILSVNGSGIITHSNWSAQNFLKIKDEDLCNRNITSILPNSPILDVVRTGKGYVNQEIYFLEKNLRFLSSCRPIISEHQIIGAVATFRPIEEVKKLILDYTEKPINITVQSIVGDSTVMNEIRDSVLRFANSTSTVLIRGESGTGKELFARAIHSASSRKDKVFTAINCSAIPDTLLESELFGYEEGAFTGAKKRGKAGKFEIADGGTIFLDEIGDMPIHLQAKILRVLQERVIERVGSNNPFDIDVRVIAATNRPLETMIKDGEFREDLYYRLNVIPLNIPPLRDRKEDIPQLLEHYRVKNNKRFQKSVQGFTNAAINKLITYEWPGNVRELENAVEYAFNIETSDLINENSLPVKFRTIGLPQPTSNEIKTLVEIELDHIKSVLNKFDHSMEGKKLAAESLGIGIATLYRKIKQYAIE